VAKKFNVSREYAQLIYAQISSPRLDKVLNKWDQDNWASPEHRAYIILVELLAHQFASPIRWIATRDLLRIRKVYRDWSFVDFNRNGHEDSQGQVRSTGRLDYAPPRYPLPREEWEGDILSI
jgi:hypothetical protein